MPGLRVVKAARTALLVLAGLCLVTGFVLGLIPTRGRAIVAFDAATGTESTGWVDCGAVFSANRWSDDDGCEAPRLNRWGFITLAVVGGVALGGIGAFFLVTEARRGL